MSLPTKPSEHQRQRRFFFLFAQPSAPDEGVGIQRELVSLAAAADASADG